MMDFFNLTLSEKHFIFPSTKELQWMASKHRQECPESLVSGEVQIEAAVSVCCLLQWQEIKVKMPIAVEDEVLIGM